MPFKIGLLILWLIVMLGINAGGSTPTKIVLNVSGVSNGEVIKSDKINLKIKTEPNALDEVTVNGESATKKGFENDYSFEKNLPDGDNVIKIVGKKGTKIEEKVFNFKIDSVEYKEKNKAQEDAKKVEQEKKKVEDEAKKAAEEKEKNLPVEFKSALNKANSYANGMHMSKKGVYNQLTSEYGEKFSGDAANYAVENVKTDWNANALAKAKSYQSGQSMSPGRIRDQLVSEYGEKFTESEADYAIQQLNK